MKKIIFMLTLVMGVAFMMGGCKKNADLDKMNEGTDFLNENMKREGVICTGSGLQYEVLKEGTGIKPTRYSHVFVYYEGKYIDGTVFDSNLSKSEPTEFALTALIQGWQEGLKLMKEGAKYRLFIPYYLGYGTTDYNGIPAYSTLIFDVELKQVKN